MNLTFALPNTVKYNTFQRTSSELKKGKNKEGQEVKRLLIIFRKHVLTNTANKLK